MRWHSKKNKFTPVEMAQAYAAMSDKQKIQALEECMGMLLAGVHVQFNVDTDYVRSPDADVRQKLTPEGVEELAYMFNRTMLDHADKKRGYWLQPNNEELQRWIEALSIFRGAEDNEL